MPAPVTPDLNKTSPVELDNPPPRPSGGNFMSMQNAAPKPGFGGPPPNSPQLMTLQGLAMVKHGYNLIANGLPALAQLLSNTEADLEKLVTTAMADSVAGTQPGVTPPPNAPPMLAPPPPPGMGGMGEPGGPQAGGPPGPPRGGPPMAG